MAPILLIPLCGRAGYDAVTDGVMLCFDPRGQLWRPAPAGMVFGPGGTGKPAMPFIDVSLVAVDRRYPAAFALAGVILWRVNAGLALRLQAGSLWRWCCLEKSA